MTKSLQILVLCLIAWCMTRAAFAGEARIKPFAAEMTVVDPKDPKLNRRIVYSVFANESWTQDDWDADGLHITTIIHDRTKALRIVLHWPTMSLMTSALGPAHAAMASTLAAKLGVGLRYIGQPDPSLLSIPDAFVERLPSEYMKLDDARLGFKREDAAPSELYTWVVADAAYLSWRGTIGHWPESMPLHEKDPRFDRTMKESARLRAEGVEGKQK